MKHVDELQLSGILGQYPLKAPCLLYYFEASRRNDNFLIEDSSGMRYVLRRYRRNPDPQRVEFQLRFQQNLHRLGFPTAEIIATRSGSLFVSDEGGTWALSTYIEGQEYDFSRPTQTMEAARYLARFHNLSGALEDREVIIPANPMIRRWWTDSETEIADLKRLFTGQDIQDELTFLYDWTRGLVREWPLERLESLPAGWVHGDYHGRNMMFVDDLLAGIFDFDVLHWGATVEDLGHAILMFGRDKRGSYSIRPDVAYLFLKEYIRHRGLSSGEIEVLPAMAVLSRTASADYYQLLADDEVDHIQAFRHDIWAMARLQEEMGKLSPIFTKVLKDTVQPGP